MSHRLISRSADLKRLRDEGYHIDVRHGHLLVRDVPYVDASRRVRRGTLVAPLALADGQTTSKPPRHVVHFIGDQPCENDGSEIGGIKLSVGNQQLAPGIIAERSFSNKPRGGYPDYYAMMTRYIEIISAPAASLDPAATAQTEPPYATADGDESPFAYIDTASSRAGITEMAERLALGRIAIVGLGGTGGYILDQVAKTPVREIHLYDGDAFSSHNAFRAPGAASLCALGERLSKVAYWKRVYSEMHMGIEAHETYVTAENVGEFAGMDFVFICIDKGVPKRLLFDLLEREDVPFIDVGLGVTLDQKDRLAGQVRTTTSTTEDRQTARAHVSFDNRDGEDVYDQNIQVADLNMLNAALAVIRWKKHFGFYRDLEGEHNSVYVIDGNHLPHGKTDR